jgi:hypothetical protein
MSKLQKKTLEAVGWLGSSGYQTVLYSQTAGKNEKKPTTGQKVAPKPRAISEARSND